MIIPLSMSVLLIALDNQAKYWQECADKTLPSTPNYLAYSMLADSYRKFHSDLMVALTDA